MAFKNVHHFWLMLETITSGVAHFSMTYLVTELNHTVFAIGHLNDIYIILSAQLILKLSVGYFE